MRFDEAVRTISALDPAQAVLILGPPGVGKSSLARAVGSSLGPEALVEVRDLCSHLPEDLLGLPYREGPVTQHAPPDWLHRLSGRHAKGVLVLDDLAAASPAVQTAAFKLVLERSTGSVTLSPAIRVIATANRREDKSGASVLPAALRNRVCILSLDPSLSDWSRWLVETDGADATVPSFLRWRPALFSKLPKDADEKGAFPTPRSWAAAARALKAVPDDRLLHEVVSGLVGDGAALEFAAFLTLRRQLPDALAILEDPERALAQVPTEPDRVLAIAVALCEHAVVLEREGDRAAPWKFLRALAYVTEAAREFAGAALAHHEAIGGNRATLIAAARAGAREDRRLQALLRHLDASVGALHVR